MILHYIVNYQLSNPLSPEIKHVIDGCALLHRIPWPKKVVTYGQLADIYVKYVEREYGPNSEVIFDGYPENTPTCKDECHMRREGKTKAPNINVDENIIVNIGKEPFLANKHDLRQFIDLLSAKLTNAGIPCVQAPQDADVLIAQTSIESAKKFLTITHAEDTDILGLLLKSSSLKDSPHDVVFKPHKRKRVKKKPKVWPIKLAQRNIGEIRCARLLFIHAFFGSDTTSRPHGLGKTTGVKQVSQNEDIGLCADIFSDKDSSKEDVIRAGELAMTLLTGGKKNESLGNHRYREYKRRVLKGNKALDPKYLPPSAGIK